MKTVRELFNEVPTAMFLVVEKRKSGDGTDVPLGIYTVYRADSDEVFITLDGVSTRLQDSSSYVLYDPASVLAEAAVLDDAETAEIRDLQRRHKRSFAVRSIAYVFCVSIFVTLVSYVVTEVANGETADLPSNVTGVP